MNSSRHALSGSRSDFLRLAPVTRIRIRAFADARANDKPANIFRQQVPPAKILLLGTRMIELISVDGL
jgi:hypothetical protein